MRTYTTSDISTRLNVNLRTAQRYVENLVSKDTKGRLIINEDVFDLIAERHQGVTKASEGDIVESFTSDEYEEFKKRLIEYPILKSRIDDLIKDLEYHRKSAESHNRQMEIILQTLQQRNYIEVKEKKLDK